MKITGIKTALVALTFLLLLSPALTFAQDTNTVGGSFDNSVNGGTDNSVGGTFNNSAGNTLQNPLGNTTSFPALFRKILQAAITIGIPIAVLFIVYAGFKLVLAQGSPEKLKTARSNLMWTLVGIAIFAGAYLIVDVIINTLCAVDIQAIQQC